MDANDNQTYFVEAIDLTHDAFGVVKLEDGYTVFVENLLKGEKAEIIVTDRKKQYGFGKVVNLSERSPYRVVPRCIHYEDCGGCDLMHMDYDLQLSFKKYRIETSLRRQGLGDAPVADPIGMMVPYHYRNKVEIKFRNGDKGLEAGFFRAKSHDLVNLRECHIMPKRLFDLLTLIKNIGNELGLKAFDEASNTGALRSATMRETQHDKHISLLLNLAVPKLPNQELFIKKVIAKIPEIKSIAVSMSSDPSTLSSDAFEVIYGDIYVIDWLDDLKFSIGYRSFFQTNNLQTEKMYAKAMEYAGLTGKEKVIDAYCGIGTIGLYAARHAKKVFGIEVVKTAVSDARENARLNDIQNALFEVGEAETVIGKWDTYKFDCIFIDPPRRGCDPKFLNAIIRMKISKVIYISCDQATLARDLKILADGGYRLVETTPVDMFPQTAAIESVSLLELNK